MTPLCEQLKSLCLLLLNAASLVVIAAVTPCLALLPRLESLSFDAVTYRLHGNIRTGFDILRISLPKHSSLFG